MLKTKNNNIFFMYNQYTHKTPARYGCGAIHSKFTQHVTPSHMFVPLHHPYHNVHRHPQFYLQHPLQYPAQYHSMQNVSHCFPNDYSHFHSPFNTRIISNPYTNLTITNKTWIPVEITLGESSFIVHPKMTQRIFTSGNDIITVRVFSLGNYITFIVSGGRMHCGVGETFSSGDGTEICKFPMSEIEATLSQCGNIIIEPLKSGTQITRRGKKIHKKK